MKRILSTLVLCALASVASAQEVKIIVNNELAGGEIHVSGLFAVRYVGDAREDGTERISSSWLTRDGKVIRKVLVIEARLPGQDTLSWKEEHAKLVAKTAVSFPPIKAGSPRKR
jgi:hypothetical protein